MITILYDNNPGREDLTTAWGFGCLIRGLAKTVLFDTGGDGPILLGNMRRLGIDPKSIDCVVLSHAHGDHTGGLPAFLKARGGLPVYTPTGFGKPFAKQVRSLGGTVVECSDSTAVCEGARTTGTLGKGAIEEHGLCIRTREGWVLVTGCAHPGVANLAEAACAAAREPVRLVLGGFHMGGHSAGRIRAAIDRLQKLGVRRAAPCHCSGDAARKMFKEAFGRHCVLPGVGSVFRFDAPAEPTSRPSGKTGDQSTPRPSR